MQAQKRSEIDAKYKWKLEDIFADNEAWEAEFAEVEAMLPALSALKEHIADNVDTMRDGLQKIDRASWMLERLFVYARMRRDEDSADSVYQGLASRSQNLAVRLSGALSFLDPLLLSLDEQTLSAYIHAPELTDYSFMLENLLRSKAHVLDEKSERLLSMAGDFSDGAQRMDFVARIDAFRRISDLEVCAALQSTFLLQDRQTELLCHAGVDRALIDHRCAQLQVTPHRTAGRNDRGQIRGIVRVDRRRNCHNDEIRLPELRFLCCKMNRAGRNSCITNFCCHVLALAVTCNFLCINIISDHIHDLRKGNCQRQAHIAQTDHSQLAFKSFCLITHFTVPPFRITWYLLIEPIIISCSPKFFKRCIFFIISLFCRCRKTFLSITLLPYRECTRRSSGQSHGQADQRTGRGQAAQLMGVSLGFPKGCGSPVATSKCSTF